MAWRGDVIWSGQALLREVVFGTYIKLFGSVNAVSIPSGGNVAGALLEYLAGHNILLEVYNRSS